VRAELTNITSKTLCFPVPNQDCETAETGFVVTTGEPVRTHGDLFICHEDGGGAEGTELDSQVKRTVDKAFSEGRLRYKPGRGEGHIERAWGLETSSFLPSSGRLIQHEIQDDPAKRCPQSGLRIAPVCR